MKTVQIIKDRNAGNSPNTYYKTNGREFCISINGELVRDKRQHVIRFDCRTNAIERCLKMGFKLSEIKY